MRLLSEIALKTAAGREQGETRLFCIKRLQRAKGWRTEARRGELLAVLRGTVRADEQQDLPRAGEPL